jgi:tetratricopeptide (TPR) repeat protein
VLHDAHETAEAYAGLGEADFRSGNYRAARRDFQTALQLAPEDKTTLQRLELCDQLLLLDPTERGLAQAERLRRSRKLVELTAAETNECPGENASPELQVLRDKAGKILQSHPTPTHQAEESESNVDLAEQLWLGRKKECKAPPAGDSPLALVLAKLSQ